MIPAADILRAIETSARESRQEQERGRSTPNDFAARLAGRLDGLAERVESYPHLTRARIAIDAMLAADLDTAEEETE